MKKLVFAVAGVAALTLAGCNSSNPDTVNNAELNQPGADQLNDQANAAANDAANSEAAALGGQNLEQENAAAQDNRANPGEAQEQNVSGM